MSVNLNIGQQGYHPREWQIVAPWEKQDKRAVFFHNGHASLASIDVSLCTCFAEGLWWASLPKERFSINLVIQPESPQEPQPPAP